MKTRMPRKQAIDFQVLPPERCWDFLPRLGTANVLRHDNFLLTARQQGFWLARRAQPELENGSVNRHVWRNYLGDQNPRYPSPIAVGGSIPRVSITHTSSRMVSGS